VAQGVGPEFKHQNCKKKKKFPSWAEGVVQVGDYLPSKCEVLKGELKKN
jgi:hypothetical protein